VVTALLVALLTGAGARRLAALHAGTAADPGDEATALERAAAAFAALLPLALGAQLLVRGERLLDPEPGVRAGLALAIALVALPAAAAAALALLAARHGLRPALVAGGAAVVLAPGFNVAATLALVALAAGGYLARPPAAARDGGRSPSAEPSGDRERAPAAARSRGAARSPGARGGGDRARSPGRWLAAGLALAAIVAPFAWAPRAAAVAAAGAAIVSGRPAAVGLGAAGAIGLAIGAPLAGWSGAAAALAWVAILLPALPWAVWAVAAAPSGGWRRAAQLAAGAALALAAARSVSGPAALAAPVALLALLVPGASIGPSPGSRGAGKRFIGPPPHSPDPSVKVAGSIERGPARSRPGEQPERAEGNPYPGAGRRWRFAAGWEALAVAQGVWSAALALGVALLAAYPWLRREAATGALGLVGLEPGWGAAPALAAAVVVPAAATALARAMGERMPWRRAVSGSPAAEGSTGWTGPGLDGRPGRPGLAARPAVWAGALVAVAVALAPSGGGRTVVRREVAVLDRARPRLAVALDGAPVSAVAVESNLAHAAALQAGTRAATVRLLGGGERRSEWTLTVGRDTGEWAARRPDVAAGAALAAPPAWLSWVALDRGRAVFGQRYRGRFSTGAPVAAERLEVERDPDLPAAVTIALYRLETAR
jgi:hypothetical protein